MGSRLVKVAKLLLICFVASLISAGCGKAEESNDKTGPSIDSALKDAGTKPEATSKEGGPKPADK
jgi:hypothetical protein